MTIRFWVIIFFIINVASKTDGQSDTLFNSADTVYFKALKIGDTLKKVPSSVSKIYVNQELSQNISLQEHVSQIPGLFSLNANNYAQDLRISIRGFGARSPFGIRGVKVIVDGIPETTPDGQGQIDNLNLDIINDIEVIKGPAAVYYGNASGGVININTLNALDKNINGSISFGSFGLRKYNLSFSKRFTNTQFLVNTNHTQSDGYRQHSNFKSSTAQLKINHKISSKATFNLNTSYTNSPFANDPGGINIDMVNEDRKSARDRNVHFDSGESINQYKVGSAFKYVINEMQTLNSYAYISGRNFDGLLPFEFGGAIDLNRIYSGHGSTFTSKNIYNKSVNTLIIGYDIGFQQDKRMRFKNLEGIIGDLTLDQIENFNNFAFFILDKFDIGKLSINSGLRYDINNISIDDNFISNGDQSDKISLKAFNPSLGINLEITENLNVFTNFRTSFETPLLSELSANPDSNGGFNSNLKPQRAQNLELGFRANIFRKLNIDITYFNISTNDELVSFELSGDDRTFFENAGKTKRSGIELSINYTINSSLFIKGYFTANSIKFDDFTSNGIDFKGKQIPGVPNNFGGIILSGHLKNKTEFVLENTFRGSLFVDNNNSIKEADVILLNFKLKTEFEAGRLIVVPFVAFNNITNAFYSDNIRINAFGGRYYEPAYERNIQVGLKFKL